MRELLRRIRKLLKDKRFRRLWYRGISTVAAIVVFFTTYALVLPAITMESEAHCGIPAHQHTSDCYEEELICGQEESDGHHHSDECYTVTKELTCTTPEHQHDESCFDEDGNLTCTQTEHTHDDTCYEEHRELTCTLKESEGHHHDSSCYKQVLTCGLEAHIHSTECYKEDSSAVTATDSAAVIAASTNAAAFTESANIQTADDFDGTISVNSATAASASVPVETYDSENVSEASGADNTTNTDLEDKQTDIFSKADTTNEFSENDSPAESSSTAATTDVLLEPVEQETLSEGYVPTLDPVNMDQALDKHTGFYYYHTGEGEEPPVSSADITSWKKVDDNTELAPTDLVKAYFAYTFPAGTLNETNQVARYRLPSNLHLTDDQIIAINQQENGIAAAYIDYDTLEILDTDNYHKYLGAEAIEGTRTPDQTLTDTTREYISAVVKAENVYDDEGIYGEKGAYLGQDLIFIFTPYTIEENQNTYDTDGNPTSAGRKVSGWFACDFNMGQVDWVEEEITDPGTAADPEEMDEAEASTDPEIPAATTIEKTAEIIFSTEDKDNNVIGNSTLLRLVEHVANADVPSDAGNEQTVTEKSPEETENTENTENTEATESADSLAESEDVTTTGGDSEEPEYKSGTLKTSGSDYTITLDYTAEACIPENAELQVREITKESDPEAYEACLEQAKEQVVDADDADSTIVDRKASRFFDIEIVVKDETDELDNTDSESTHVQKIEPAAPVSVNIQLGTTDVPSNNGDSASAADEEEKKQKDPTVLHFADQGVEEIESAVNDGFREVSSGSHFNGTKWEASKDIKFEAESFSVYGVVYTTLKTTYITTSGETYEITVTYDNESSIPEDSELKVREIEKDSEEYTAYLNNSTSELGMCDAEKISFARFFDIEILDNNGVKTEPEKAVTVQITYRDAVGIKEDEAQTIVHFAEKGAEVIAPTVSDDTWTFEASSFSVYGTIVAEASEDLSGRTFTISKGGNYLTSELITGSNNGSFNQTIQFKKDSDITKAAVWEFEAAATSGQYHIFTYVDGVKKYMSMSQNANNPNRAHAVLSNTPQAFTITPNNDGTYKFKTTVNNQDYWLNEDVHEEGFAGWHAESQSGTGDRFDINFTQPILTNNEEYMVLVKIGDKYYIVLNNGELEETEYPINDDGNVVGADTPMLWKYNGSVLYHEAEAVAFNQRQVASDFYYRYIDPRSENGLAMDDSSNTTQQNVPLDWSTHWGGIEVTSRQLMTQAAVTYSDHIISSASDSSKVLRVVEENGKLKIAGGDSDGEVAEVYLAKLTQSDTLRIGAKYHAVDHIDISVEGRAGLNAPLAYGTYYYMDGGQLKTLIVSRENPLTLSLSNDDVEITKEDIKNGTIVAYTKDEHGNITEIPNAFAILGYSGNAEADSGAGHSTAQVRIDGTFKVADLPPVTDGTTGNDNAEIRRQRLENRIYYSVSTSKKVSFDLVYNGHQLYASEADARNDNAEKKLTTSAMITLSNSFDYWDSRNECPGIWLVDVGYNQYGQVISRGEGWKSGRVLCSTSRDMNEGNSGMDFALGNSAEGDSSHVAVEITKFIVDTNGHPITPNRTIENVFHVYEKEINKDASPNPVNEVKGLHVDEYDTNASAIDYQTGYVNSLDKHVAVGEGGMGAVYDYDVNEGMVYIEEDTSEQNLPRSITDENGKVWYYKETHFETEYVWRNDGIEYRRHFSKDYTLNDNDPSSQERFFSIPDVLGSYKDVNGIDRFNGFLEFYTYNVYEPEPTDIKVEKIWKYKNGLAAEAPEGAKVTVTLGRYKLTEDPDNPVTGDLVINQAVNGPDAGISAFRATYKIRQGDTIVRTGNYDAAVGGANITGLPGGTYIVEITGSAEGYDVTNTPSSAEVTVVNGDTIANNRAAQVSFTSTVKEIINPVKTVDVHVTNCIDSNSSVKYQDMHYTYPGGSRIVLNISRPGPAHNIAVTVSVKSNGVSVPYTYIAPGGNDYATVSQNLFFDLPEEGTYEIAISHGWGNQDLWVNSVAIYSDGSNTLNSMLNPTSSGRASQTARINTVRLMVAPTIEQAAVSTLDDDSAPESPVPGMKYLVDDNWSTTEDPVYVVLSGIKWSHVFDNLPPVDDNGNKYLYFIKSVEEEGVPEGTEMSIKLTEDEKVLTSSGETTLEVLNALPNVPPKVKIKKVDENGMPMTGVKFSISKNGGETAEIEITSGDGIYTFEGLSAGSYVINETEWPAGYKQMPGSIAFDVSEEYDLTAQNTPDGVDFDEDSFTYTVTNEPNISPGQIAIRKQWQDFYGNAATYEGTVDLKIEQWVPASPVAHNVSVIYKCLGTGSRNYQDNDRNIQTELMRKTGSGSGDVTVSWTWNNNTNDSNVRLSITDNKGNSYQSQCNGSNANGLRRTFVIPNVSEDLEVTVLIDNYGWFGTNTNLIDDLSFSNTGTEYVSYTRTGGTKTITLGTNKEWLKTFTVAGDGLLSESSTNLPATHDGKDCYYTINEESIPSGYTVSYSNNNDGIREGILTAYNRKNTVDVDIIKADKNNTSQRLNGATFRLRQIDPTKNGNMDTRTKVDGRTENQTTAGEGINQGKLSFANLSNGIYEIKETIAPAGYILVEDAVFYIKVGESGVQLLQMDETTAAESWTTISSTSLVTLQNGTATVGNEAGAELPSTGGAGTKHLYLLGCILTVLAAAGMVIKRRY